MDNPALEDILISFLGQNGKVSERMEKRCFKYVLLIP